MDQSIELSSENFILDAKVLSDHEMPMFYRVYSFRNFRDEFGKQTADVITAIREYDIALVYTLDIHRAKEHLVNDIEKLLLITDNFVVQPLMKKDTELYVYISFLTEIDHVLQKYGYSIEYSLTPTDIVVLNKEEGYVANNASPFDDAPAKTNKTLVRGLELWNKTR